MPVTVEQFLADDAHYNLDFEVEAERHGRLLGCKPGGVYQSFAKTYEDEVEPMTDAELRLAIERRDDVGVDALNASLVTFIHDQKQEGSCTGNGTVGACEVKQAQEVGKENLVLLSPISVYKQVGRNADSGATIEQVAKAISTAGALPLDTPENRAKFGNMVMPATGFSTPFPDGWRESAKVFIASNILPIRSFQSLKTALVKGDPVVVGRQGHCVYYTDLLWNPDKGRFEAPYPNSWGKWGSPFAYMPYGFGRDSESYMKESSYFAFAVRTMVVRYLRPAA